MFEEVWARASRELSAECRVEFRRVRSVPVSTPQFFVTQEFGEDGDFGYSEGVFEQLA